MIHDENRDRHVGKGDINSAGMAKNRLPSLLACTACRGRHLKCDGKTPTCDRCLRRNSPCAYLESRRGEHKKQKNEKANGVVMLNNGAGFVEFTTTASEQHTSTIAAPATFPLATAQFEDFSTPERVSIISSTETDAQQRTSLEQGVNRQNSMHEANDLIDVFYRTFFLSHPFIIPRKLLSQIPDIIPEELKAVMRYVGSHYAGCSNDALRREAFNILSDNATFAMGFGIQGRLCLAIILLAGRNERNLGMRLLTEAIDMALSIGLHRKSYVTERVHDHPILAESWRRTWWDLYTVDHLLSALESSKYEGRLRQVYLDLPLPGHYENYVECRLAPLEPTLEEMSDRAFSESCHNYSAGAYKVEATRILGLVLALGTDIHHSNKLQEESADVSIRAFWLSLPLAFREVSEIDGKVNEVLFGAHMIIHWATIVLHQPRSTLIAIPRHYQTSCSSSTSFGAPDYSTLSHTTKLIHAANGISNLITINTPPVLHTPCFACAIALSAIVHLSAYAVLDGKDGIKERLRLAVSALAQIGEVWPIASLVQVQIAQFARERIQAAANVSTTAFAIPKPQLLTGPLRFKEIDFDTILDDDTWIDELDPLANIPILEY